MQQRNSFEMKAHDIQYKKARPSFEHTIETYSTGAPDRFAPIAFAVVFTFFGIIALAIAINT